MSDTRTKIANALVKVTNRWIAPNFPADWKLREFAELDDREQRLNLDYADAALGVIHDAPTRLTPADYAGLRDAAALEIWHRFADSGTEEWADETHKAEYVMCADAILAHTFSLEAVSPSTASSDEAAKLAEEIEELNDVIESVKGDRGVLRVSGTRGDPQDVGVLGIARFSDLARRLSAFLRATPPPSDATTYDPTTQPYDEPFRHVDPTPSDAMTGALALGDIVEMHPDSPYAAEWRGVTMKVVSLRIEPDGRRWVSVIEGNPRHRGNGFYDGETDCIEEDHLRRVAPPRHDRLPPASEGAK